MYALKELKIKQKSTEVYCFVHTYIPLCPCVCLGMGGRLLPPAGSPCSDCRLRASQRSQANTPGSVPVMVPILCPCVPSSMVIRDLTLRSAASFGSFHLIRLLYDEYMFYLVEHRVAQATGETPIAVMGEVRPG